MSQASLGFHTEDILAFSFCVVPSSPSFSFDTCDTHQHEHLPWTRTHCRTYCIVSYRARSPRWPYGHFALEPKTRRLVLFWLRSPYHPLKHGQYLLCKSGCWADFRLYPSMTRRTCLINTPETASKGLLHICFNLRLAMLHTIADRHCCI